MIPQIFTYSSPEELQSHFQTYTQEHNISTNSPDTLIIYPLKTTIGIDQIRLIQTFLVTKPKSQSQKSIILFGAEKLTLPAQNAFLKTLEESPTYASIHLLTVNHKNLLPTMLSRCNLAHHTTNTLRSSTTIPFPHTKSEAISLSDNLSKDKENLHSTLLDYIYTLRQALLTQPNQANLYNLTLSLYTKKLIHQNINPKLVLDNFFFLLKPPDNI